MTDTPKRPRATRQEVEATSRQILLYWSQGLPDYEIKDKLGISDNRWKSCVGYIAKTGETDFTDFLTCTPVGFTNRNDLQGHHK